MRGQKIIIGFGLFLIVGAFALLLPVSYAFNSDPLKIEIIDISKEENIFSITIKLTNTTSSKVDTSKFKLKIKSKNYNYDDYFYVGNSIEDNKIITIYTPEKIDKNIKISYQLEDL